MGACLSANVREEDEGGGISHVWSCLRSISKQDSDVAAADATTASPPDVRGPQASLWQPQRRPEMEAARIQADRNLQTTNSGQWFATPIPQQADAIKGNPTRGVEKTSSSVKKRKRSLSAAIRSQIYSRRPRTAPERPPVEWRVSLRSFGTRSPFPDFSAFAVVDDDDSTSFSAQTPTRSPISSLPTSPQWPLPNNPSDCPLPEPKMDDNTETNAGTPIDHPTGRRTRALSEPFRYAKRRRAATVLSETQNINAEIQELQILVEAKKKKTTEGTSAGESEAAHAGHPARNSSLMRSKSRGHVPAVAPSMKVHVRSQVLTDIGSAFSKPLSNQATPRPATPATSAEDVSKASPPHHGTAAPSAPASTTQHHTSQKATPTSPPSPKPVSTRAQPSGPAYVSKSKQNTDTLQPSHHPSSSTSTSERVSVAPSVSVSVSTASASDTSTSRFATEPTTPPLSRVSSAQTQTPHSSPGSAGAECSGPGRRPPTGIARTLSAVRSSSLLTGIWEGAKGARGVFSGQAGVAGSY